MEGGSGCQLQKKSKKKLHGLEKEQGCEQHNCCVISAQVLQGVKEM